MSDADDSELKAVERELHNLKNDLRAMRGRPPVDLPNTPPEAPYCSFCGKAKNHVRTLIAGATANICDECVDLCQDIIKAENPGGKRI